MFFVAFLVAATIVLSLIPLYLPEKTITRRKKLVLVDYFSFIENYFFLAIKPPTFILTIHYDNSIGNDGYLDQTACNVFARSVKFHIWK